MRGPRCELGADTDAACGAKADYWVWLPGHPRHPVCSSHLEQVGAKLDGTTAGKVRFEPIDPRHRRRSVIDLGRSR